MIDFLHEILSYPKDDLILSGIHSLRRRNDERNSVTVYDAYCSFAQ